MQESDHKKKSKKTYCIKVYKDWCKRCGICVEFCPKSVLVQDESGLPIVKNPDECIGCGLCEIRCPDFAIEVKNKELSFDPKSKNADEK